MKTVTGLIIVVSALNAVPLANAGPDEFKECAARHGVVVPGTPSPPTRKQKHPPNPTSLDQTEWERVFDTCAEYFKIG